MRTPVIVALALAVVAGCKSGSNDKPAATGSASGSPVAGSGSGAGAGSGSGSGSDAARPDRPTLLTEAAVRDLISRWLAAQNAGDFAAYDAAYAGKLEGVKRAKGRTWRFDRAGWMADRKRMFAHPMVVETEDLTVKTLPTVAVVELTQAFTQGKFHDEGPKRIVVVVDGGQPKIAREEMVRSVSPAPIGTTGNVYLVDQTSHDLYLQLVDVDADWGGGTFGLEDQDLVLATRAVTHAPAAVTRWKDTTIPVYSADGVACTGTIGDLYLQAGETPHFGTRATWRGEDGDPALTEQEIAQAVFGTPYLLGHLTLDGACSPVVAIATGTPVFYPPTPDPAVDTAAIKAFRKTDTYRSIQAEYKDSGGSGTWADAPAVTVFGAPGGPRYVSVSASAGAGCGEWAGELWTMWSMSPSGHLEQLEISGGVWEPFAVFDSDGDGAIEMVGRGAGFMSGSTMETYFEYDGSVLSVVDQVEYPYNDCPC